jgi:predicted RNase H-like nuclease
VGVREVCFWALNGQRPMLYKKKTKEGVAERVAVLSPVFPEI